MLGQPQEMPRTAPFSVIASLILGNSFRFCENSSDPFHKTTAVSEKQEMYLRLNTTVPDTQTETVLYLFFEMIQQAKFPLKRCGNQIVGQISEGMGGTAEAMSQPARHK